MGKKKLTKKIDLDELIESEIEERFNEVIDQEVINQIIANIDAYLKAMGINVARYQLGAYDLDGELRSFIEVYVNVKNIKEMLRIWENTINFLRSMFEDSMLENVDIFFTREVVSNDNKT